MTFKFHNHVNYWRMEAIFMVFIHTDYLTGRDDWLILFLRASIFVGNLLH